jgi:hypothetical protein
MKKRFLTLTLALFGMTAFTQTTMEVGLFEVYPIIWAT